MKIKHQVNAILNKPMDRQDFLRHIAIGVLALTGVGAALRLLAPDKPMNTIAAQGGYGGSAYGGDEEKKI